MEEIRTRVNGQERVAPVDPDQSALSFVRERLELTGSKLGCGHGACGACTMMVDGTPVAGCLLPATSLDDRDVTTVEGIGPDLHPVQRAFMAEDALQCGFCTPGFIVEAVAFHGRWREEHGDKEPERDDVAAALAGHLCRCGAYEQIYSAVQKACAGKFDDADPEPPRREAKEKVTGQAKYTVDVHYKGQLEGRILRSPHAHARVRKVDKSKALALSGVRAAVDLLTKGGIVRYAGQEILAIAADNREIAEHALRLVEVQYDVLTPVVGMDAARAKKATPVYPKRRDRKGIPNAAEGPILPSQWSGNVRGPFRLFSKKAAKAKDAVDYARTDNDWTLAEGTWRTQVQCHTALEPHACVAKWDGKEQLTVHMSTQSVTHVAEDIVQRWKLRKENVRVLAEHVGGGFGAKASVGPETVAAIELAKETGEAVRVVLDRREELGVGGVRPAQEMQVGIATDDKGKLAGISLHAHSDAGTAIGGVAGVMFRIMYPGVPKDLNDWDVTTHAPPGKPFRGPGGPPTFWALESAIDMLAHKRGEDPLTFRRNAGASPIRAKLFDWVETLPAWTGRGPIGGDKGRYRRGVGLATSAWFAFSEPATRISLEVGPEGLVASTSSQDMGNGTRSAIALGVAGVFGIAPSDIDVRIGDSNHVHGPMSTGSRTTASCVPAAKDAANRLRDQLFDVARREFKLSNPVIVRDGIDHDSGHTSWKEIFAAAPNLKCIGRRKRDRKGYFLPFKLMGIVISKYLAASAQVTEVEVDMRLGKIRPLEVWAGFAAGRIVSPELARSQAQGGIIQGLSYALYEERRLEPQDGTLLTGGLEDYRIAGIGDIPKINVHFMKEGFDNMTGRIVGIGELTTLAPAGSVSNAVHHATGWRPMDLPIRPDRVVLGVNE